MHRLLYRCEVARYGLAPYLIRVNGEIIGKIYGDPTLIHQRASILAPTPAAKWYYTLDLPFYSPQAFGWLWRYLNGLDELHTYTMKDILMNESYSIPVPERNHIAWRKMTPIITRRLGNEYLVMYHYFI